MLYLAEFFSGVKSGKVVVLEGSTFKGASAEVTSALPLTADEQDDGEKGNPVQNQVPRR